MVCVFGSFVIGDPLRILGVFGLGLAVAVLIDATVVRMVLVPAVMQLLGAANWWLPRWMARAIPSLAIEPDADQLAGGGPCTPAGHRKSPGHPRGRRRSRGITVRDPRTVRSRCPIARAKPPAPGFPGGR